jgi:hypothetical protein
MSDAQPTSALFAGGDPAVLATYERLLAALREIGTHQRSKR